MTDRLAGKVALITGGTSGIGAATARLFAAEGACVVIVGRSEEKGQKLADSLGSQVIYSKADITQEADIAAAIALTVKHFGKLDILFNNAGGPVGAGLQGVTPEHIQTGVSLLLSSVILGIKHAIGPMTANGGGSIINNSSIAGLRHLQGDILYSAIKAAVSHYTRLAGVELGPLNIRVNAISPGAIATPIFYGGSARANTLTDAENEAKMAKLTANLAKAVPLQQAGLAVDIAEGALYLASDASRFVTSHDLVIDGGRTAMFNEPRG